MHPSESGATGATGIVTSYNVWLLNIWSDSATCSWVFMIQTWSGVDVMIRIFCDFCQFPVKKWRYFQKPMLWSFFANTSSSLSKECQFFREFFGENIFLIITSVPGNNTIYITNVHRSSYWGKMYGLRISSKLCLNRMSFFRQLISTVSGNSGGCCNHAQRIQAPTPIHPSTLLCT
jgi:hypothetical protein